ncbi:hypothetical protein [Nesterenkonia jeotgali]|uniref:Uncharacterized protein n=1 Tax=Nesterenkonia jeotgali TaxID=317018 RepID=A0A839FTK3_9MICC|nr:hypothetical protein [Nesterenkonia jeotgali]MBA8922715.1 hypothetical protein [Nesterenkonia jeotgali]
MDLSQKLLVAARVTALIHVAVVILLFVSAGFLVEESRALGVHGFGAIALHVTSGVLALNLLVLAWRAKTGGVAAAVSVALFALTFLQASLGSALDIAMHISGSVVLTLMAASLASWTFSTKLSPRSSTTRRSTPSRPTPPSLDADRPLDADPRRETLREGRP